MAVVANVMDLVSVMTESVINKIPMLYSEYEDPFFKFINASADVQKITRYLWRVPLDVIPSGYYAKGGMNGAALPFTTAPKYSAISGGYQPSYSGHQFTDEMEATDNSPASVAAVVKKMLASAAQRDAMFESIHFYLDGRGILTDASSAATATTMTFAGATDAIGIKRLEIGMGVEPWNGAGTAKRVTVGPCTIVDIDYDGRTVTLNQAPTGLAAGDILAFPGMDSFGPGTLTSFNAGYPGAPGASAQAGIGVDSGRHGLGYMLDTTAANYYFGVQKSALRALLPIRVNAAGAPLTMYMFMRGLAKWHNRWKDDEWTTLRGLTSDAQRQRFYDQGAALTNILLSGQSFGTTRQLMPEDVRMTDAIPLPGGLSLQYSPRMANDRLWFVNVDTFFKAELEAPTLYKDKSGSMFFQELTVTGTAVNRHTAWNFWMRKACDYGQRNPGRNLVFDNLEIPAGWDA